MKMKRFVFMVGLSVLVGLAVNAQQGGYKGPGAVVTTVAEAKTLRDDTPVILQGRIDRFLGDERYLFSDDSGNITVEMDDKIWGTLSVDQNDLVEITGEVDRGYRELEVEVRTIRKL
jgi:uncharacterized protein (TIGR00156 family)